MVSTHTHTHTLTHMHPLTHPQIRPPVDKYIQKHIEKPENLEPEPTSWDTASTHSTTSNISDPLVDILSGYFTEIQQLCHRRAENARSRVRIVYTPMHGVGADGARRAFKAFNLPEFIPVPEQVQDCSIMCMEMFAQYGTCGR